MLIKFFGLFIQIKTERFPQHGILLTNTIIDTQAFNDANPYLPALPNAMEFFPKHKDVHKSEGGDSLRDKLRRYLKLGLYKNHIAVKSKLKTNNKKPILTVIQSLPPVSS